MHSEDRERLREAWRAAVRDASPLEIDVRIKGKDGSHRWFKTRAVPIRDEQGSLSKWYGTHTDVDELKRVAGSG